MARLKTGFLFTFVIVLAVAARVWAGFLKYETGAGPVEGKLNVHLVPHSHDDVGWLKTVDQYYVGSNNSIQGACVANILDSLVVSLLKDPNRKFVFAEQAFFQRWWDEQNEETQEVVMKLVDSGQLEFINGGWCMHDEATCHYIDMIDQTTLGHRLIKKQFNKVPRVGWQIDPFGHSAVQAYLLGAEICSIHQSLQVGPMSDIQTFDMMGSAVDGDALSSYRLEEMNDCLGKKAKRLKSGRLGFSDVKILRHPPSTVRPIRSVLSGTQKHGANLYRQSHLDIMDVLMHQDLLGFDSLYFARIDYQDRVKRKVDKSLEVIWRGSKTFGSSSQIFTSVFPVHYSPPRGFNFEVNDEIEENHDTSPIQDDPRLYDYNVEQRVNDFIDAARTQANVTRTNHIMWTMGDDFQYQYAESWFKQMDKLIHYINKDGRVNAFYSTPSIYTNAKNTANESWPLKTDDYFPYADSANAYWTGFFTSRPALKRYTRMLSGYYLAARQLEYLVGRRSSGPHTFSLGDALGIAQHHDAVTGTAPQHTTNDYAKRLALGASETEMVVSLALSCATNSSSSRQCITSTLNFGQCHLLNISYCPPTEDEIPENKSLVVVAYNPLGWIHTDIVRIPVNDDHHVIRDSSGNTIEAQYVEMDNATINLRNFYTKAYLGVSAKEIPKHWLLFQVSLPPLGWSTYFISKAVGEGASSGHMSVKETSQNETLEVGPGNLKMSFSSTSGQLKRMTNYRTGVDIPIQQSYLWYGSSIGDKDTKASGAYIFRPDGAPPTVASRSVPLKIVRGPLVDEVHQQFNPWIYQVTRLYKDKEHAEVEFTIGPIPVDDGVGKEVITRMTANMATDRTFYTDSNGRDFLKRVRDHRTDWPLEVTQPVAGNYYPINLGIYMLDGKSELSVLVDSAIGGASVQDGELELMLHRRMVQDDSRGVVGALDEIVCVEDTCEGLTIRGYYYISINQLGSGAHWRRTVGQQVYSPLLLAFTHEEEQSWKASHLVNATSMDPNYSLPPNVAVITLQELDDGNVLLRLAHVYEAGEDAEYSSMAKVELKKMFASKMIKEVKETSLSTNQDKSEMRSMKWKVEGDNGESPAPMRGGPVNNATLIVELGPMEIRTFLLKF